MAKSFVWVSFDLGVAGDYESLYSWLDDHDAVECGDSLAAFWYEYKKDILKEITADIKRNISVNRKTRMYLVRSVGGKTVGRFIIGPRRKPPWTGYARTAEQTEDSADA